MSREPIPAGPKGFVESDSEQVYFESWGSGETVVLSHGMGGNHAIWYQQVPALAEHYQVVTWDQRGFGRSTAASGEMGPGPSVGDIGRILDHLDVEQAHIVGQSMGGWASLGFALECPDRTSSLVLADTIAGIFTSRIRQAFMDYGEVIATSPPPDQLPLGSHPAVGGQLAEDDLARSFLYSQIGGMTAAPSPLIITELLLGTDYSDRLDGLRAPTLFVVGENDPIFTPGLLDEASGLIPDSELRVVPNTGHSPYFERPAIWNDIVVEFLQRSTPEKE